jgi:hypothetical protein
MLEYLTVDEKKKQSPCPVAEFFGELISEVEI